MSSSESTRGSCDRIALDTSVAIDVLAAKADIQLLSRVSSHLLPAPVVGELRYGALNSQKATENLAKVEGLVSRCVVLNVTVATANVYAEVRLALKQKRKPVPENDLWIAALVVYTSWTERRSQAAQTAGRVTGTARIAEIHQASPLNIVPSRHAALE